MDNKNYVEKHSRYNEGKLSGIYRAFVENTQDPLKLARVQIRVPMIHGVPGGSNYQPTENLPWATPITPSGSGYDHGSCLVPEVGDVCFVFFEDNDRNYPLYLGGCYGKGGNGKIYGSDNDPSTYAGGTWDMPNGASEVPAEVYNSSGSPTGKVIYKSPKGATIVVEEADGKESIKIIDALGQSIRMATSMHKGANSDNQGRRGTADAYNGTSDRAEELSANGYAEVAITDASGQQIQMMTGDTGSSIQIMSGKNRSGAKIILDNDGAEVDFRGNHIQLREDYSEIEVGDHHIRLQADGAIQLSGVAEIIIGADGSVSIKGKDRLSMKANRVDIDSNTCIIRGDLVNYSN